jgi:hypothetical protein
MTLNQTQKNMVAACQEVLRWCDRNGVAKDEAGYTPRHRLQRIAIMTVMTESGGHMYANANIPTSLKLPHDAIGNDHHSVGLFQQQVGSDGSNTFGWGTVQQCMDINHSVDAFLRTLKNKDLHMWRGPSLWLRCQYVQISAFPDGSNYRVNYMPAKFFIDDKEVRQAIRGKPLETN